MADNRPVKNIDSPLDHDKGKGNDNKINKNTSISIVEKTLGNNNFLLNSYLKNTINLVKSIIVKNDNEAKLYNELLLTKYNITADKSDKSSWRYYKHILGLYHQVDSAIYLISIDNLNTIELTKDNVFLHRKTKEELLKFGLYYKELVDKYPEQELYIKAIITDIYYTYDDIKDMEDYTILGYNQSLIEDNETNLIYELQDIINNHKVIWLIPYYSLSDSLFLTTQLSIFYNFLVKTILNIRLKNAKTNEAHSFHIKNYLASHHNLDIHYDYLTNKQRLFLYKNLLYLDNHSGNNEVFKVLIDKLFTEYNISIVGYDYKQHNELDNDSFINYSFNQRLLNNKNLVYSQDNFTLLDIKDKEKNLTYGNSDYLDFNINKIDFKLKNSLLNTLLTKDLETIIIDQTDVVKYRLIPTIIDYWAYLCKEDKMNYVIRFINPITNNEISISAKDAFKLYIIILFYSNEIHIDNFPTYTIKRVYNDILPTNEFIFKQFYKQYYWYNNDLNVIKSFIPSYSNILTSYQFQNFVSDIYKLNLSLWLYTSNLSDLNTEGQYSLMIDRLHKEDEYSFNDETVHDFLYRYGLSDIITYDKNTLDSFAINIVDLIYDNKLKSLSQLKYIQKAMVEIFKQFKSYSTQLVNNYYAFDIELPNLKDTRYNLCEDSISKLYNFSFNKLNVEELSIKKLKFNVDNSITAYNECKYLDNINVNLSMNQFTSCTKRNIQIVSLSKLSISLGNNNYLVNQSSESDLQFLAMHS